MGKTILCHCEDVDVEEVHSALDQGFGDLETLRRYTGIGTGKCQGKCCIVQTLRVLAAAAEERGEGRQKRRKHGLTGDPRDLHLPTARPPILPMRVDDIIEARKENE